MANFYLFEIANWNEGTANLTLEQEAAYLRIVNAIRLSDQPLTMNKFALCGMWRCNERKAKRLLDDLISAGKISIEGGKIVNSKAVRDALTVKESRPERLPTTRRPRADHAPTTHRLATDEANTPHNPLKSFCAPVPPIEEKSREEKSLTDTSYLPDSMTDCSAAASQSPPISSEIEPPPAPAPECAPACDAPAPECARAKPEEGESVKGDSSGGDEDDGQIALAVASFNRIAGQVGWPKVKTPLSKTRKSRLKARIKRAGGVIEWIAAIRRGSQSAFLTGGGGRNGWKASFDFFAQESSFDRLIEGNYDDNHRKPPEKYDAGTEGARGAGAAAGSRNQRRDGGPHRGLLAGFARASSGLDAHTDVSGDGADGPAHR